MKVQQLIKFLHQEIQDEEVILLDESGEEFIFDEKPPRHAGPQKFTHKNGNEYIKSLIGIWIKKRSPNKSLDSLKP